MNNTFSPWYPWRIYSRPLRIPKSTDAGIRYNKKDFYYNVRKVSSRVYNSPRFCMSLFLCPSHSRADKDESRTRIDLLCTYHSGPTGLKLDREQLYWELSQLTQGVTKLGFYTLDRNSLYVNGEQMCLSPCSPVSLYPCS
jgi:hypothetical protein